MTATQANRLERLLVLQAFQLQQVTMSLTGLALALGPAGEMRPTDLRKLQRQMLKGLKENCDAVAAVAQELAEEEDQSEEVQGLMLLLEGLRRPIGFMRDRGVGDKDRGPARPWRREPSVSRSPAS